MFNKTNTNKSTFGKKSKTPAMTEKEALMTSFKTGFCYGVGGVVGTVIATTALNAVSNMFNRNQDEGDK